MELSELTTAGALLFNNIDYKMAVKDIMLLKKFSEDLVEKLKTTENVVFGNQSEKN